jgi:hypothetical protein
MLAGIFLGLGITGLMKSASSGIHTTERENNDISNEEIDC